MLRLWDTSLGARYPLRTIAGEHPAASSTLAIMSMDTKLVMQWMSGRCARTRCHRAQHDSDVASSATASDCPAI